MSQSPCGDDDLSRVPPGSAFSGDGGRTYRRPARSWPRCWARPSRTLGELDERQLLGAGTAARRLRAYADYMEIIAVAEFARRRAEQFEASKARGDRVRSRDGEYPAEELGFEMTATAYSAASSSTWRPTSSPGCRPPWPGWRPGAIDRDRARVISNATLHLSDELAAEADKVLAEAAPELRAGGPAAEGGPARGPPGPRGRAARKDEAGGTGGSSCAGRTRARRRWPGGSWTRPRRWRGRRRSTPRRSGSATRACPAPWPRSGR